VHGTSDPHAAALFGAGRQADGECPVPCNDDPSTAYNEAGEDRENGVHGTYTGTTFTAHDFSSDSETLQLFIDGRSDAVTVILSSNMHSVTATVDALNLIQETKRFTCRSLSEADCEGENGCYWDALNGQSSQRCGEMWRAETSTTGEKVAGGEKCRTAADCTGMDMLDDPQGLLVKGANLYIVDSGNHRVVEWPIGASVASRVVAGTGAPGDGLDELDTPMGIGVDWTGALYVADTNNNRVLRYESGSTTGTLVAGSQMGEPGTALNSLTAPTDVKVDYAGNVYISDTGNHRIVKWCAPGVTDLKCEVPPDTGGETVKAWPDGVRLQVNSTLHCDHPFGGAFGDVCDLGCLPDWAPSEVARGQCVHAGTSARNHFVGHEITCTPPGSGCVNSLATNFDPEATVDDGSCVLPTPFPWWIIVVVIVVLGLGTGGAVWFRRRRRRGVVSVNDAGHGREGKGKGERDEEGEEGSGNEEANANAEEGSDLAGEGGDGERPEP
jgi:DNA-binding beta-propeller fold protein YncE